MKVTKVRVIEVEREIGKPIPATTFSGRPVKIVHHRSGVIQKVKGRKAVTCYPTISKYLVVSHELRKGKPLKGSFSITHLPTGAAVAVGFKSRRRAELIAAAMSKMLDWRRIGLRSGSKILENVDPRIRQWLVRLP